MSNESWQGKWNEHVGVKGREFLPYIKMEHSMLPIKLLVLVHVQYTFLFFLRSYSACHYKNQLYF